MAVKVAPYYMHEYDVEEIELMRKAVDEARSKYEDYTFGHLILDGENTRWERDEDSSDFLIEYFSQLEDL